MQNLRSDYLEPVIQGFGQGSEKLSGVSAQFQTTSTAQSLPPPLSIPYRGLAPQFHRISYAIAQ